MWKSITVQSQYFTGYTYMRRVPTKNSKGKVKYTFVTITNPLTLVFIRPRKSFVKGEGGNVTAAMAKAVVPTKWFTDNAISPSRHDFVIKNEIRYKVVGIEQYDEGQRMNVYYLMLKREELAA